MSKELAKMSAPRNRDGKDGVDRDGHAPPAHTFVLAALVVSVAILGTWLSRHAPAVPVERSSSSRIFEVYVPLVVVQCGLVVWVARAFRRRWRLHELVGRGWDSTGRVAVDLAIAAALVIVVQGCEVAWSRHFGAGHPGASVAILPHDVAQRWAWALVAIVVGASEELVYRGYFRTQFGAFARSPGLGNLGQAVLFGVAHLDQGPMAAARIGAYGLLFGAIANVRGSLVAVMIGHVAIDLVSGLVSR